MALCSSNVTSGFIDLATFDEIEKYLYGGEKATAYFVRETRKANWHTSVPMCLSKSSGQPHFGQEFSFQISRAGDYLLQTWLRVQVPAVTLLTTGLYGLDGRVRWTRNLMHNLVRECSITFNDLVAARFDNYHLDFWAAFTVPASKYNGYQNMIGNFDDLTAPHGASVANVGATLPSVTLNLPLPFFYSRDSGVALPTAALPYNDMRINFAFRNWDDLLIMDNAPAVNPLQYTTRAIPQVGRDIAAAPELSNVQLWANYAIVSNDERKRMGCAPRDILIEQVQTAPRQSYTPATNTNQRFDIRFSHAIKVLFFAVRNSTYRGEWSNYTTASPYDNGQVLTQLPAVVLPNGTIEGAADPVLQTSLIYENTQRLSQMGSDYFSLVNPYYHAPRIPEEVGYHCYSYSLDFYCLDPLGSTNYGKLTNVSIVPEASQMAVTGANGTGAVGSGMNVAQQYEFIVTAVNNNIIRVAGGALGFPVL